jgi:hypothetical protein
MSRIDRALESRERESRAQSFTYTPPQQLPDPDPQDGYEPVRIEDHPEMAFIVDDPSKLSGNVEIGGLMLCKQLEEKTKARQAYYDELSHRQIQSVDNNFMRENDPRMPLFTEKRSEVSFNKR